jgi:hypothetical protein
MTTRILGQAVLAGLLLAWLAPSARAQAVPSTAYPQVAPYQSNSADSSGHRLSLFGRLRRAVGATPRSAAGSTAGSTTNPAGTTGLPRGRRYYNGRYFGDFNNRFYSPQYGYF